MARLGTQTFSGGMNTWLEPWQLELTQCVDLLDGKVSTRAIRSANGHAVTTDTPDIAAYLTANRSVFKFGGKWFWSENDVGGVSGSLGYVGILPPTAAPVATLGARGTRFTGTYRYAVTYETADGYETCAFFDGVTFGRKDCEVNATKSSSALVPGNYEAYSTTRVSKTFTSRTRYGYEIGDRVNYSNRSWECIQTFYDREGYPLDQFPDRLWTPQAGSSVWKDITESTILSTGHDSITLTLPQPTQAAVTVINVYRSVTNGGDLYLLASVPAGTTGFTDIVTDLELLAHEPYTAAAALPPVYQFENGVWTQKAGKYLTGLAGVFYLAYEDRLYISEQDNPHAWQPTNYLLADDDITAIGLAGAEAVLVFTKNRVYRVTGSTLVDITKEDLKATQGCPNWRTLTYFRNQPVWVSYDGLCAYSPAPNRDGNFVTVLTEGRYRFTEQPDFGVTANDTYYAFYADHAVCFDFRAELAIYRLSIIADFATYDPDRDRLLASSDGTWYHVEGGDHQAFSYLSPEMTGGGLHGNRHWRKVWVNSDCDLTLTPIVDGEELDAFTVTGTGRRYTFLPPGCYGPRFQLRIAGTGTLRSLEVEVVPLDDKMR